MAVQGRAGTISLRSHLLAGTAAMATAAAITVSGVTASGVDLTSAKAPVVANVVANVELTAWANPLLEIFDTIEKTNFYLFSIAEPPFSAFDRAGIIPDFLAAGFPILTQYFLNASDYVASTVDYFVREYDPVLTRYPGALRVLTWAAQALPENLGIAVRQVFNNELVGALQTLQFAIVNPIQAALYQTLNSGIYVAGGVTARAAAVVQAIADWIPKTLKELADSATVVYNAVANVVANVTYGIQLRDPERIWNSLVNGLLGSNPSGPFDPYVTPTIPDALIDQTIGPGGRIYIIPGVAWNPAPSIRQNLTDLRTSLEEALATEVPEVVNPPFILNPPPLQSAIPTPWNPTPPQPVTTQVAASVPIAEVPAPVSVEEPATAVSVDQPAPAVDDSPAVSVREPAAVTENTVADPARPARAGRGAVARAADAPEPSAQKPSRQAGARSASR